MWRGGGGSSEVWKASWWRGWRQGWHVTIVTSPFGREGGREGYGTRSGGLFWCTIPRTYPCRASPVRRLVRRHYLQGGEGRGGKKGESCYLMWGRGGKCSDGRPVHKSRQQRAAASCMRCFDPSLTRHGLGGHPVQQPVSRTGSHMCETSLAGVRNAGSNMCEMSLSGVCSRYSSPSFPVY